MPFDYNKFMMDPMAQMGLGILAANRPGATAGQAIGQGLLGGMQNMQRLEDWQQRQQERKKREEAQAALAQQYPQLAPFTNAYGAQGINAYAAMNPTPDLPTGMRPGEDGTWQYDPNYLRGQEQLRRAGATVVGSPKVEIINKGEEAYIKDRQKADAEAVKELANAANFANRQNRSLDRFASSSGAMSGGAAPLVFGVKNFLSSFGYTDDQLKDTTTMQAAIGDMKANYMRELGARGLTDQDMIILAQALPRVETDAAARKDVARILRKNNNFVISEYRDRLAWEKETYPGNQFYQPTWLREWQPQELVFPDEGDGDALVNKYLK